MSITKEERYLLELYKQTKDDFDLIDRYELGKSINHSERLVKNTVKLLTQMNFIKKSGKNDIYITKLGIELAESLLKQTT